MNEKKSSTKKLITILCSIVMVVAWCLVIFRFSATPSKDSNGGSIELTQKLISKVVSFTDKINHTDSQISEAKLSEVAQIINKPLRKVAHATIYSILALILLAAGCFVFGSKRYPVICLVTLLFCFIFAMTDEYHQTFVDGRTGQFSDVLVDGVGACITILVFSSYYLVWRIGKSTSEDS